MENSSTKEKFTNDLSPLLVNLSFNNYSELVCKLVYRTNLEFNMLCLLCLKCAGYMRVKARNVVFQESAAELTSAIQS